VLISVKRDNEEERQNYRTEFLLMPLRHATTLPRDVEEQ